MGHARRGEKMNDGVRYYQTLSSIIFKRNFQETSRHAFSQHAYLNFVKYTETFPLYGRSNDKDFFPLIIWVKPLTKTFSRQSRVNNKINNKNKCSSKRWLLKNIWKKKEISGTSDVFSLGYIIDTSDAEDHTGCIPTRLHHIPNNKIKNFLNFTISL